MKHIKESKEENLLFFSIRTKSKLIFGLILFFALSVICQPIHILSQSNITQCTISVLKPQYITLNPQEPSCNFRGRKHDTYQINLPVAYNTIVVIHSSTGEQQSMLDENGEEVFACSHDCRFLPEITDDYILTGEFESEVLLTLSLIGCAPYAWIPEQIENTYSICKEPILTVNIQAILDDFKIELHLDNLASNPGLRDWLINTFAILLIVMGLAMLGKLGSTAMTTVRFAQRAVSLSGQLVSRSESILRKIKNEHWMLILGLAPLILYLIWRVEIVGPILSLWSIPLYFCAVWAIYLYTLIKPPAGVWRQGILYALFTLVVGIPLLLLTLNSPLFSNLYVNVLPQVRLDNFLSNIFLYFINVGVPEELTKALPLLLFGLFTKKKILNAHEGLFLGAMSGLGFALAEDAGFFFTAFIDGQIGAISPGTPQFLQLLFLLMTGPVLHAAMAGVVGWFIGTSVNKFGRNRWQPIAIGLVMVGALHATYNALAISRNSVALLLAIVIATVILYLFLDLILNSRGQT